MCRIVELCTVYTICVQLFCVVYIKLCPSWSTFLILQRKAYGAMSVILSRLITLELIFRVLMNLDMIMLPVTTFVHVNILPLVISV
jgi:hypothetical protein